MNKPLPPRAFDGCTCECHKGVAMLHFAPCCSPKPGWDELRPKLQDEIDRVVKNINYVKRNSAASKV